MINKILNRSKTLSVSGNEDAFLKRLECEARELDCSTHFTNDCLIVKKKTTMTGGKRILVSVGVDMPGWINLGTDQKHAYLANAGNFTLDDLNPTRAVDENGKQYILRKTSDSPPAYFVSKNKLKPGDSLGLFYRFREDDTSYFGYGINRFVLIETMVSLLKHHFENEVIFSFTVNSLAGACRENQLINKYNPQEIFLLGSMEDQGNLPIILGLDGKAMLTSKETLDYIRVLKNNELDVNQKLSKNAVTNAEKIYSKFSLPIVSIALPTLNLNQKNETVAKKSILDFEKAIILLLNHTF